MDRGEFNQLSEEIRGARIAVLGDFCLDRYLEIDPHDMDFSIETGLQVFNVKRVRSQAGAAGTILNNLAALGVKEIFPVGFHGRDGEGFELRNALGEVRGSEINLEHFFETKERRTFTYTKPLLMRPDQPPQELNRLDFQNDTQTPSELSQRIAQSLDSLAGRVDAVIVLDQVDWEHDDMGVVTESAREAIGKFAAKNPRTVVIGDSRSNICRFPDITLKMNARELHDMAAGVDLADAFQAQTMTLEMMRELVRHIAEHHDRKLIVTLGKLGIVASNRGADSVAVAGLPLRGDIDVVGAGDAVTANLAAALCAGASDQQALEMAMAAASTVIHQLGTTGVATLEDVERLWVSD